MADNFKKSEKGKPKFPGKLNVNQIDNTYVKPGIVKELQNKSVVSKTTMPIVNRFSNKVNTNKIDNTYVAPSVTKDLTVKTKTSNSTVPVSNWAANKNKNAVAEAVAKNKPTYKPKFPGKLETNQVDDTYVAPAVSDMRNAEQKKLDYKNYKDNQKLGKSIQNIAVQTALDQVNIPYTEGMKNTRRNFPIGTMINSANDVNDLPSFSNPYLGVINTSLNRIKPSVPVMGDLAVNALQEGLQRGDEEYATNDFKAKKYLKEKGINSKNIGYIKPFAGGGRVLPKFGNGGNKPGNWAGTDRSGKAIQTNFANSTAGENVVTGAGIAGAAVPMLTSFIPDDRITDSEGNEVGSKESMGKGILNGAAQGASMGAAAGPWGAVIGAGVGAIYGGVTNSMNNDAVDKAQQQANMRIQNRNISNSVLTNKNMFSTNVNNNDQMIAAKGGTVVNEDMGNPNAELELNETFRDPMTGETGMVDGPSHDNGGIEMSLAEGTQIWSDRLKHNGRTFASLTKPIINKIANIEKGLDTNPNSRFKQNSIKLLNAQLDFFFDIQESNKQQDEMKRTLKKQEGGVVDDMGNYHYANGGIYIKPENRGKFTAYKERTGKTTEEALHSPDPHVRQMANFAKNAAGWKHAEGGYVLPKYYLGGEDEDNGPNTADIYKRPTSNVNGIEISNNPYDKRQFMLDQINTNRTFYNGDSAKTSNSFASTSPVNNLPVYSGNNDPFRKMSNQYDPNIVNASKVNTAPVYNPYNKPGGMINFNRGLPEPKLPQVYNSTPYIQKRGNQNPYKGTDITGNKTVDNNGNIVKEPTTNQSGNTPQGYVRNNKGELIQAGALAGSAFAQLNNINRQAAPGIRPDVRLSGAIPNPKYVDLSAERGAINRSALGAMGNRDFGNSATAQAFKNKARINQLEGLGKSFSNQEIANADIGNKFAGMRGDAAMKEAMMNNEIANTNLENKYQFNQNRMANQNAAIGVLGHGVGDIGRNRTNFSNDMEKANVLSNQYESSVLADTYKRNPQLLEDAWNSGQISKNAYDKYKTQPKAKYGGTIKKRSLKY